MKRKRIATVAVWSIIALEFALGLVMTISGYTYSRVDTEKAETMLSFIRDNNPSYYAMITDPSTPEFRDSFYEYFTEHRNPIRLLTGMALIVVSLNTCLLLTGKREGRMEESGVGPAEMEEQAPPAEETSDNATVIQQRGPQTEPG